MSRKNVEQAKELADQLASILARFPAHPRGKLASRTDAMQLAAKCTSEHSDQNAGLQAAISKLKRFSHQSGYFEPLRSNEDSNANRRKLQIGKVFSWNMNDSQTPMILHKLRDRHLSDKAGKGNRADFAMLTDFIRALLEIERLGLPSPLYAILPAHMQVESFAGALVRAEYIKPSEAETLLHSAPATLQKLRAIRRRAKRIMEKAAAEIK